MTSNNESAVKKSFAAGNANTSRAEIYITRNSALQAFSMVRFCNELNYYLARFSEHLITAALLVIIFCIFALPVQAQANHSPHALPSLKTFIKTVKNGDGNAARGVYIPHVLALPVTQQPEGNSKYVSENYLTVTQFSAAAREGNVGLLAHNYLAGRLFFKINQGRQILLIYGDGRIELFIVESIRRFQALPHGGFRDLASQNALSTGELFEEVYSGAYHLTLQTCIEKDGDLNWGRLFVIAQPINLNEEREEEAPLTVLKAETPPILGWPLLPLQPDAGKATP